MIFKRLQTKNFKALGTKTLDFTDGLNFVLGENGKGKTTVFRAISVALFGSSSLPGVADHITSWGETSWSVELEFSFKSNTYMAKRSKSSASLFLIDVGEVEELVASGHTPVTKYVEDLTKMTLKDFDLLVHSKQDETDYILNYGATALQRKVEELAGVDVIESIMNKAKEERKLAVFTVNNTTVPESKAAEIKELEKFLTMKLPEVVCPEKPEMEVSEAIAKNRKWNEYNLALKRNEETREKIAELEEELQGIGEVEEIDESEYRDRVRELRKAKKAFEEYQREVELVKSKIVEDLVIPSAEFEVQWNREEVRLLGEMNKVGAELEEFNSKIAEVGRELDHVRTHIEKGVCNSCGTVLTTDLGELKERKDLLLEEEYDLVSKREEVSKVLAGLEQDKLEAYKAYLSCKNDYDQAVKAVKANDKLLLELCELESNSIAEVSDAEIDQVVSKLAKIEEFNSRVDEVKSKQRSLQKRVASLNNSLEEVVEVEKFSEKELRKVEGTNESYYRKYEAWVVYTNQLDDLMRKRKQCEEMRAEEVLTQKKLEELKALELRAEKLGELGKFLGERREAYLKQVWDAIMSLASDTLNTYTEGWITELNVMEGKFVFMENGVWSPTVEASGAQKSFIGAALRIALKKCLYGNELAMMFDEPTGAMSEVRSRQLMDSLTNAGPQVLVITHRQTDSNLADNLVTL